MKIKRFYKHCLNFLHAKVINFNQFSCNVSDETYKENEELIKNINTFLIKYRRSNENKIRNTLISEKISFNKDYYNIYLLLRHTLYLYNNIIDESAQDILLKIEHNVYISDIYIKADTKKLYELLLDKLKELNS